MKSEKSINDKASTELHKNDFKWKIVWENVFFILYIYLAGIYGLYVLLFRAKFWSFVCTVIIYCASVIGITVGSHRLWSHRSFKAKWPMKLILMIFHTIAYEGTIHQWAKEHRVHHKFTDTDADPYSRKRGFFFAHMGCLLIDKHPECKAKCAAVDCSDLEQDPIVAFQQKWYTYLMPLFGFIIPTLIPWLGWNESLWYSWHLVVFRCFMTLNTGMSINSFAHTFGWKPYDKSCSSVEHIGLAFWTLGEGWHNYHHAFPWDYKAAEFGSYGFNWSTAFIDFFASLGLAYDLKFASDDVIKKHVLQNGNIDEYEKHYLKSGVRIKEMYQYQHSN